jgi:hypothetical protein
VGIISGVVSIAYVSWRAVKWAQNIDRQIRDMRLVLRAVSNLIYALYLVFWSLYDKIRGGESLSVNDVVSNVVVSLGKTGIEEIVREYLLLTFKESEKLDPNGETKKRELLRRFQEGRITYAEALELRGLLEEQKRRHEEAGNIVAAFLALIILLLLLAFLASLTTGEKRR